MDYFPHRTPVTNVASAISASNTPNAVFLANFYTTPVDTASVALNIRGQAGSSGTSFTTGGPQGAQGARGNRGARGKNIYILASTRGTAGTSGGGVSCVGPVFLYNALGTSSCLEDQGAANYYSTGSIDTWQVGTPVYVVEGCGALASDRYIHTGQGGKIYHIISGYVASSYPQDCPPVS